MRQAFQTLWLIPNSIKGESDDVVFGILLSARRECIGRRCWAFAVKIRNEKPGQSDSVGQTNWALKTTLPL